MVLGLGATIAAQRPPAPLEAAVQSAAAALSTGAAQALDLNRCVAIALANSNRLKAAGSATDAARARHGQALSSRYPSVSAGLSVSRLDDDPNFVFPALTMGVPAGAIQTPPMLVTLPAHAFGPGFPPANVPLPVPGSTVAIPAQTFQVPEQNVRLMDRTLYSGTLSAMYALYTGGLAGARVAQAKAGVEASTHESRQTEAELVYDVTRAYYGVVLAKSLRDVARDTLDRMEATLTLTESLYQSGSGRVKKTDYLRNKAMAETIRTMVLEFEAQERTARAALATTMEWDSPAELDVADRGFPTAADDVAIEGIVERALSGNPRIAQLGAGLSAAKAGVVAARAGHLPKVGLFADLRLLGNAYSSGLVTPENKTAWTVGVGVEVPLFEGFRVVHAVGEARAAQKTLEQQLALLQDGVAFEATRAALDVGKGRAQRGTTRAAFQSATENRELQIRAYQNDLADTKDVIEAQLMEAVLAGQHYRVLFDLAEATARLDMIVGKGAPGRR